jgi:hypothetical protein
MSRKAMQMALEALEDANDVARMEFSDEDYYSEAINALRQALKKEQEPVALPCVYITSQKDDGNCYGDGTVYRGQRSKDSAVQTYTVQAIEAKLKEKNQ